MIDGHCDVSDVHRSYYYPPSSCHAARIFTTRPLPPRAAGERDSLARDAAGNRPDPCHLVWRVRKILTANMTRARYESCSMQNLIHLPRQVAGVCGRSPRSLVAAAGRAG